MYDWRQTAGVFPRKAARPCHCLVDRPPARRPWSSGAGPPRRQGQRRDHGRVPRAEVLGAVVVARGLLEVGVHVLRAHVPPAPPRLNASRPGLWLRRRLRRARIGSTSGSAIAWSRRCPPCPRSRRRPRRRRCARGGAPSWPGRSSRSPRRSPRRRSGRTRGREAAASTPAPAPRRGRRRRPEGPRPRAGASAAAPARSRPCGRTSPGRGARASAGGRGTACAPRRRFQSPEGGPSGRSRSRRPPMPEEPAARRGGRASRRPGSCRPSSSKNSNPRPRRRRRMPGPEQSLRRRRAIVGLWREPEGAPSASCPGSPAAPRYRRSSRPARRGAGRSTAPR